MSRWRVFLAVTGLAVLASSCRDLRPVVEGATPADGSTDLPNDSAGPSDGDAQTPIQLNVALVANWRFDETSGTVAVDSGSGRNHATLTGAATWTDGRIGGALDVAPSNALATVSDPASGALDFGTSDFTICAWFRTRQTPDGNYPEIVSKLTPVATGGKIGYELLLIEDGRATFQVWSAPSRAEAYGTSLSLNDGQWHHLTGRKTANEVELFVDGVRNGSEPHTLKSVSNEAPLVFGGAEGMRNLKFAGQIDSVLLYARALTDAEIAFLAEGNTP